MPEPSRPRPATARGAHAALALTLLLALALAVPAWAAPAVRIGYLQSDIHHLACWVALEKGLYQAEGVKVEVAGAFKAGPELMSAFSARALDLGYVGEAPATTAVANLAARVVVLAQVNTEGSALVVRKGSAVKSVADLQNRGAAVPGFSTVQDFLLRKALAQAKVDPQSVNIMVIKPPEMISALRTGQIEAFIAWQPHPAKAETMGVGQPLMDSGEIWKDHPCCVLACDENFLRERREEALGMVRAHLKANAFIAARPEEALAIGVKYTGMDEATVRLAMKRVKYTPELSVEGERDYVEFLNRLGYIKVGDVDAFMKSFLNSELLEQARGK